MHTSEFSAPLQSKVKLLKDKRESISLGRVEFESNLLLAPMASICTPPFRLLMEDLGAGGTVSELISCHGINYENKKTLDMLKIDEREKNTGIQLFGEDADAMAKAAVIAQRSNPKFLDINMGCPVKKVVSKGGGSALMKDIEALAPLFSKVRSAINVPLTIKIRTGWDNDSLNALEIEKIAREEGIEFLAIHGRTRNQQYSGLANWEYIEELANHSKIPIIGNGDLHQPHQVRERMLKTDCDALMIARGCLRNPFIFLEAYNEDESKTSLFNGNDYWEVIQRLYNYTCETYENDRMRVIQLRKLIVWFAAGFIHAAKFRGNMFASKTLDETMKTTEEYFQALGDRHKKINHDETFMTSGHG